MFLLIKINKLNLIVQYQVPRGIRGEKSSKDMASRWIWSLIRAQASTKIFFGGGAAPGVQKGKRSCWHAISVANAPCTQTTHNSAKVKFGIKVMKLVESLLGLEVTIGQGLDCHLTFVRGK